VKGTQDNDAAMTSARGDAFTRAFTVLSPDVMPPRFTKWSSTGRYRESHREREEGIWNCAVHVIAEIEAAQDTRA
jgi:hypothetical protein